MFIEINNLKKSFGSDSNRVEVLRGVDFSIILSVELMMRMRDTFPSEVSAWPI